MTGPTAQKKILRRAALARRDALDPAYRLEAGVKITGTAAANIAVRPGMVISAFLPIRSEVDLRPLIATFAEKGARICLPAIIDPTTIVFREFVPGSSLVDMGFGTSGPGEDAAVLDPAIMLIPLAAFDRLGHRIGYGAGYYDRAIARLHALGMRPDLIGVAFDCQEVEEVPNEAHDVALSQMLTESGLRFVATD